jgi:DNA-damage-inducible protein J
MPLAGGAESSGDSANRSCADRSPHERRDMSESAIITLWVHPMLEKSARRVLRRVGLNTSDAITLFLKKVVRQGGLPFDAGARNVTARKAERATGPPAQRARRLPGAEGRLPPQLAAWVKARGIILK